MTHAEQQRALRNAELERLKTENRVFTAMLEMLTARPPSKPFPKRYEGSQLS